METLLKTMASPFGNVRICLTKRPCYDSISVTLLAETNFKLMKCSNKAYNKLIVVCKIEQTVEWHSTVQNMCS